MRTTIALAAAALSLAASFTATPAFAERNSALSFLEEEAGIRDIPRVERAAAYTPIPRSEIAWYGSEAPGTIIINTTERRLYLVQGDGTAIRYGIGVGRPGFEWSGRERITRMAEWPTWTPPEEMRQRQPGLPESMPGGVENPLGARALYLGGTLYRIHGSNEPWTIGQAVSSGCIRMTNDDVVDLYERVRIGAEVIVL
ncbi:MAG: L,D-transpeptidase [Hyphomicrobiaceae bacterium]|nr:L,D-transpeptidase [Hyphomicrobiaceae bacterium]